MAGQSQAKLSAESSGDRQRDELPTPQTLVNQFTNVNKVNLLARPIDTENREKLPILPTTSNERGRRVPSIDETKREMSLRMIEKVLAVEWKKQGVRSVDRSIQYPPMREQMHFGENFFIQSLRLILQSVQVSLSEYPVIMGRQVDLFALFLCVIKLGGYDRVTVDGKWVFVGKTIGMEDSILVALFVRAIYARLLFLYEQHYFKRRPVNQWLEISVPWDFINSLTSLLSASGIDGSGKRNDSVSESKSIIRIPPLLDPHQRDSFAGRALNDLSSVFPRNFAYDSRGRKTSIAGFVASLSSGLVGEESMALDLLSYLINEGDMQINLGSNALELLSLLLDVYERSWKSLDLREDTGISILRSMRDSLPHGQVLSPPSWSTAAFRCLSIGNTFRGFAHSSENVATMRRHPAFLNRYLKATLGNRVPVDARLAFELRKDAIIILESLSIGLCLPELIPTLLATLSDAHSVMNKAVPFLPHLATFQQRSDLQNVERLNAFLKYGILHAMDSFPTLSNALPHPAYSSLKILHNFAVASEKEFPWCNVLNVILPASRIYFNAFLAFLSLLQSTLVLLDANKWTPSFSQVINWTENIGNDPGYGLRDGGVLELVLRLFATAGEFSAAGDARSIALLTCRIISLNCSIWNHPRFQHTLVTGNSVRRVKGAISVHSQTSSPFLCFCLAVEIVDGQIRKYSSPVFKRELKAREGEIVPFLLTLDLSNSRANSSPSIESLLDVTQRLDILLSSIR